MDEILIKQDHKCIICGISLKDTRVTIDHDHKTGMVRGILCTGCNVGLGYVENKEFVKNCNLYLGEGVNCEPKNQT